MRSLADILIHPRDDAEEQAADRHIRRAMARIRRSWSPAERYRRRCSWGESSREAPAFQDRLTGEYQARVEFPSARAADFA